MRNFLLWCLLMATFGAVGYLTSNIFWGFGSMFIMAFFIRHYVVPSQGYYYDNNDDDFQMPSTQEIYINPATGIPCLGIGFTDFGGHSWGSSD